MRHLPTLTYDEIQETKDKTQHEKILWLCERFGSVDADMAYSYFKISQFHARVKELKEKKGYSFEQEYCKDIDMNVYRLSTNDEKLEHVFQEMAEAEKIMSETGQVQLFEIPKTENNFY